MRQSSHLPALLAFSSASGVGTKTSKNELALLVRVFDPGHRLRNVATSLSIANYRLLVRSNILPG